MRASFPSGQTRLSLTECFGRFSRSHSSKSSWWLLLALPMHYKAVICIEVHMQRFYSPYQVWWFPSVLQALLRQKQSELLGLEKREAAIFIRAKARAREREMEEAREAPLPENHYCSTLLVTENNNTVQIKLPPEEVQNQRDVRPKLSPVNPSTDSKLPAKCQIRHEKASPVSSGKSHRKHNPHSLKASKAKLTQGSPTLSKISKQSTKTFLNPSSTANGTKLTKGMSKLALTDEPTAYERILFAQSRQPTPPDSLALRPLADSPMFRSVRHSKSPPAVDPLYRSMRLNKSSDSQSQQEEIQLGWYF